MSNFITGYETPYGEIFIHDETEVPYFTPESYAGLANKSIHDIQERVAEHSEDWRISTMQGRDEQGKMCQVTLLKPSLVTDWAKLDGIDDNLDVKEKFSKKRLELEETYYESP